MKPAEVFGPGLVRRSDECWMWLGKTRITKAGGFIPCLQTNNGVVTAKSVAAVAAGFHNIKGVSFESACGRDLCVHPLHIVQPSSEVGRMLYIKRHSRHEGDCLVWTGNVKGDLPVMPWDMEGGGQRMVSVPRFVYGVEYNRVANLPPTVTVDLNCGTKRCVEPTHLVLKGNDDAV